MTATGTKPKKSLPSGKGPYMSESRFPGYLEGRRGMVEAP